MRPPKESRGKAEGKRKEKGRARRKRERVECLEAMNDVSLCLSFVGTRVREKGGGHTGRAVRIDMCGDPWKDMRTTSLWFIYTPVSTVTRVPVVS